MNHETARQPDQGKRPGFSLVELLVIVGIIVLIIALALPAVQRVREAYHRIECAAQLRQIGIALHHLHQDYRSFPSNGGWDGTQRIKATDGRDVVVFTFDFESNGQFFWGVGQPGLPLRTQTGSWAYALLPYLEADSAYLAQTWAFAPKWYICSSRRNPESLTPFNDHWGIYEGGGWQWGKIDYAANAALVPNRPQTRNMAYCTDGTTNTIFVGEKSIPTESGLIGSWYWDEPFFCGGSHGTQRQGSGLLRDSPTFGSAFRGQWGSSHPNGVNFLFVDGSVRNLSYATTSMVIRSLLTPQGGEARVFTDE